MIVGNGSKAVNIVGLQVECNSVDRQGITIENDETTAFQPGLDVYCVVFDIFKDADDRVGSARANGYLLDVLGRIDACNTRFPILSISHQTQFF